MKDFVADLVGLYRTIGFSRLGRERFWLMLDES